MFEKSWYIGALVAGSLALTVACESDEFDGAPTVQAPQRSEARAVEPGADRAAAQQRPSQAQNLPADHPPIDQAGSPGAAAASPNDGKSGVSPEQFGEVGPLRWQAPADWRAVQPSSNMRLAEYHLASADGGEPATLAVFYFGKGGGGSIQDNIDRWVGQFEQTTGEPEQSTRTANGLKVHLVDASGTFNAGSMMGGGQPKPNWRMLAAITETPAGNFFFKLTGPEATVDAHEDGFDSLVSSFEAAQPAQ